MKISSLLVGILMSASALINAADVSTVDRVLPTSESLQLGSVSEAYIEDARTKSGVSAQCKKKGESCQFSNDCCGDKLFCLGGKAGARYCKEIGDGT